MTQSSLELDRINEVYAARKSQIDSSRYSMTNDSHRYMILDLEEQIIRGLSALSISIDQDDNWLDVGCGTGFWLATLNRYGLMPGNSFGVDAIADRIRIAREANPQLSFQLGDARQLDFGDGKFSFVSQFTMLSSVLDKRERALIAKEMIRVTKPGGLILSYDFFWPNPANKNVTPISKGELVGLFPGCRVVFRKVTLAPPIVRTLAPLSKTLCDFVSLVPFLRTHFLTFIIKGDNRPS